MSDKLSNSNDDKDGNISANKKDKASEKETKKSKIDSGSEQRTPSIITHTTSSTPTTTVTTSSSGTHQTSAIPPKKVGHSDEECERKIEKRLSKDYQSKDEDSDNSHKKDMKVTTHKNLSPSNKTTCGPPTISPVGGGGGNAKKSTTKSPQQTQGKRKRSHQQHHYNRRSSKYNVAPGEKLLEDKETDFDDVADAYMEAFLAKVSSVTEKAHPGVYGTFIQALIEARKGSKVNQSELHGKVKGIFKDYPNLLREFESFLDPSEEDSKNCDVSLHVDMLNEIGFLQKMEKFTENCPQLKSKILNKLKSLKEKPNLEEKDVANVLEQFFVGNSVMMESFRSLLPEVYKPQSTTTGMDWELIELDMDGGEGGIGEEIHFEIVKLPDETKIPATSTCPCVCHDKAQGKQRDVAFSSRAKHCRNCSLKFQDGKIFIHNGRVMRPVSVELTPSTKYSNNHGQSSSISTGNNSKPGCSTSGVSGNASLVIKKEPHHSSGHPLVKTAELKGPE